jgi:alpha 1,6-mannosyltransferase
MLSFRKAFIAALFILTFIYLMQPSTPKAVPTPMKPTSGSKYDTKTVNPPPKTTLSRGDKQTIPPPSPPRRRPQDQSAMVDMSSRPLRERLRYQFPYDMEGKFPAYIWQTWKATPESGDFDDSFRPFEASWTEKHPGFVHQVVTDAAAVTLIRYLYASIPEVQEAYNALPVPVLKADFFRYLILLARGGIYSDIDTTALKSATDWIPANFPRSSIGLVIGIEADPDREDWAQWYSRRIQFCQWTIEAKPGHPVLRDIVASITEDILRMKKLGILRENKMDKSIVEFTGPAIWTDTIMSYFNSPDNFDMKDSQQNISWLDFTGMEKAKKVGDVVVLPITSFSPGVQNMGAKDIDDEMAFVHHEFEGMFLLLLEFQISIDIIIRYLETRKRTKNWWLAIALSLRFTA